MASMARQQQRCLRTCRGLACNVSHEHAASGATLQLKRNKLDRGLVAVSLSVQAQCREQ